MGVFASISGSESEEDEDDDDEDDEDEDEDEDSLPSSPLAFFSFLWMVTRPSSPVVVDISAVVSADVDPVCSPSAVFFS